jgi:methenyltetrahydrofolate cyclohydrolase
LSYLKGSIKKYIDDLAARRPVPGGGSSASLCGAMGAALLEMVCNYTLGNVKYKDYETDIKKYLAALKNIGKEFSVTIDKDVKVYSALRKAFKTKNEKLIDKSLRDSYHICMRSALLSGEAMTLVPGICEKGNVNLITDAGCGAEFLNASFSAAVLNAEINLKSVKDNTFRDKERRAIERLKKDVKIIYRAGVKKAAGKMR